MNKGRQAAKTSAHRLGNTNNDLNDGPAYVNLNNEASNANWNCGVGCATLSL